MGGKPGSNKARKVKPIVILQVNVVSGEISHNNIYSQCLVCLYPFYAHDNC